MQIPVYIDGKEEGTLTIGRDGPVTVMEASLRDVGRLVRLSVFGERQAYLGVPEPREGRLYLMRRLTPSDMRQFPAAPEYAANCRRTEDAPRPEKTDAPARHVLWHGGRPYYF